MYGVPEGSVLGTSLFNIDLIDLHFEYEDDYIISYAADITPYSCAEVYLLNFKELPTYFLGGLKTII